MSKFTGDHIGSIDGYEKALLLNIESPEEAHCNIANIYSQELLDADKAKYHYTKALELNTSYVQAKFNLAGLLEREGKLAAAGEAFLACADDPDYKLKSLTRALELVAKQQDKCQIVQEIERFLSLGSSAETSIDTVDALFSLGRFYESEGIYNDSWSCFNKANKLDAVRRTSESVKQSLAQCELIKDSFDFNVELLNNDTELVFICGLFRSGSTLLESMLATHPNLISGGEIDVFRKHLFADSNAFSAPLSLKSTLAKEVVTKYLTRINQQINALSDKRELRILDKQPENFLLLGYIKKLFPKAKFIWTCREKSNSIFSIYTQHFGFYQPYSCNLSDICTFYQQHLDLLTFWQQFYADDIKVVEYEDLVNRPGDVMSEIQTFLGISADNNFDKFYQSKQLVSTASMAQVRKPLHKNAINRAQPYLKWMNL
jgi:tetratricopeptide (TPR) repeat protein